MSVSSSSEQVATARSDAADLKPWSGFGERSRAIIFAGAAVVAMVGWLFMLAQGLRAAASRLIS
jgi:hypothetical protein